MAEEKQEEEPWQLVQKKTFTRWCNMYLKRRDLKIDDLYEGIGDGVTLCHLLEITTGKKLPKFSKRPRNRFQKINNFNVALDFITKKEEITLVNIGPVDLLSKDGKLILGLIWTLILKLQIGDSEGGAKNELLKWVNKQIKPFESSGVKQVKNFTKSWTNGKALCALCESLQDGCFDNFNQPAESAIKGGMDMAEEELEIPQLMDMEDILNAVDEHSMMTYISLFRDWQETGEFLPDAEKCYAEGKGLRMGEVDEELPFTIFCRDQNGKLSPGPEDGFEILITDEEDEEVQCDSDETAQGIIGCAYTPYHAGIYTISIKLDGIPIRDSPYTCKVIESGERDILDPPDDCICTIMDKYKDYHSYISEDGDCVNKYGDILGYINLETLEVGGPDQNYWGNMEDEIIYNSQGRELGKIDQGKGWITDSNETTVCEIDSNGEMLGNASTTLGEVEGFSFRNLSVIALYLMLVDDDMLVEEEDD